MSRLTAAPQPCLEYRRYLAGDVRYVDLNPGDVQQHLNGCSHGCPDYWTIISYSGSPPPVPDFVRMAQVGAAVCRLNLNMAEYVPEPGTPALHVLICWVCRGTHLNIVSEQLREAHCTGKLLPVNADEDVCIPFRRYLAGDSKFADVNPSLAEAHLAGCLRGCADFWGVLNPAKEEPSAIEQRNLTAVCPDESELAVFHPKPGSVAMHLMICRVCRNVHRRLLVQLYRARYCEAAPTTSN